MSTLGQAELQGDVLAQAWTTTFRRMKVPSKMRRQTSGVIACKLRFPQLFCDC
ncbi:MAG: hypothetical protein O2U62_05640 [Candidatus Bathyarchaeota archaeon]|nr:hypothetical protein [Candidatus Bathyarchaeota archaeon]